MGDTLRTTREPKITALWALISLVAGCAPAMRQAEPATPQPTPVVMQENVISGKYTPPAGKTLFIVGQDLDTVAGYVEHVWETPGGVTT